MNQNIRRWIIRGAVAALLLIAVGTALLSPRLGWARERDTNTQEGPLVVEPQGEAILLTDHPEGRTYSPPPEGPVTQTNSVQPLATSVDVEPAAPEGGNTQADALRFSSEAAAPDSLKEPGR